MVGRYTVKGIIVQEPIDAARGCVSYEFSHSQEIDVRAVLNVDKRQTPVSYERASCIEGRVGTPQYSTAIFFFRKDATLVN